MKKLDTIPQSVKASAALFFATIITKGIAYITTPIYTHLLSTDEYGKMSVYVTMENAFGIVAMFSLSAGVFNNGMLVYPDERDEYSFSMLMLSNLITLISCALMISLHSVIRKWIAIDLPFIILMSVYFLLQPAYSFWTCRKRYELKYKLSSLWTIIFAIFPSITAVVCILLTRGSRLYAQIFGSRIALIILYIGFYVYLAIKAHGKVNTRFWKVAFLFNLPLIPHYLSGVLLGSADKLMISNMVGDEATAYYSVAYSVSSIVMVMWTAINASLVPFTYEKCKTKDFESISKVTMPILFVFALVCLVVTLLAPEVIAIMGPRNYNTAVYVIPPIIGGVFFQVQYFIYANVIYYYEKPRYVMYASVSSVVLNIVLNYFFIQRFGFIAAGYTTLVSYFVQACLDFLALRKVVGSTIYNMKQLGILSLFLVIVILLGNFVYDKIIIRYVIVMSILIGGFHYRKKIPFFTLLRK